MACEGWLGLAAGGQHWVTQHMVLRLLFLAVGAIALQRHIGDAPRHSGRSITAASTPRSAQCNIRADHDAVIDVRMSAEHRLEGRIVDSLYTGTPCIKGVSLPLTRRTTPASGVRDSAPLCVCGDGRKSELAAQRCGHRLPSTIDGGLAWAEQSELRVEDDGGLVGSAVRNNNQTNNFLAPSTRARRVHRSKSSDEDSSTSKAT